jgi:hypothetical protein
MDGFNVKRAYGERHDVVVIGAGPVGLAAAAHLVSRGIEVTVLEAGSTIAASIEDWAHLKLFSPWRFNIDKAAVQLLSGTGWLRPDPDAIPTGRELIDQYLKPLADHPLLAPRIATGVTVKAIGRAGSDKIRGGTGPGTEGFSLLVEKSGTEELIRAGAVIDATGTWKTPNPLGANGVPAVGEHALSGRIRYGLPDILGRERDRYIGRRTAVVGSGLSAATELVALAELAKANTATEIVWVIRAALRANLFGGGENDELPARGQLGTNLSELHRTGRLVLIDRFRTTQIEEEGGKIWLTGQTRADRFGRVGPLDEVICATGQRPDLTLTRELRVETDSRLESVLALAPLVDPNLHYCGSVKPHGYPELRAANEPGFFTIGAKSYGRAPSFLMATGYEQARSIAAALAGDMTAALQVELALPKTGICSTDLPGCCATESGDKATTATGGGCCGPTVAAATTASCCGPAPTEPVAAGCCGPAPAEPASACGCGPATMSDNIVVIGSGTGTQRPTSWGLLALSSQRRTATPAARGGGGGGCCG